MEEVASLIPWWGGGSEVTVEANDWRLMEDMSYLRGLAFEKKDYVAYRDDWDHDHCEFCWSKFSATAPDALRAGYTTEDNYRWICERCFDDFHEQFALVLADED